MKILFILHFPPPLHGPSVVGGYIKGSGLINKSFECRYINLSTSESVEEIGRKSVGKIVRYFILIWQVIRQLFRERPDLCYFTTTAAGPGFYKDALIIGLVKLFRVTTVFHYHNKGVNTRQDKFFDDLLYRLVFRKTHVILLSKHLYPDVQKYVSAGRVSYCPNGIPDFEGTELRVKGSALKIQGLKRQGESGNKNTEILFLSHLNYSKGVLILIEACEILRKRDVSFHCKIAGGDADLTRRDVAEIIAEKGLAPYIEVLGTVYGEVKQKMMRGADIFVHPSYEDCMPLVQLEAMQYSIPVVSTFEGAIPDVVEDGVTGFLVPQKDAAALADKIEVLIKNPGLRETMGAAGRKKYEREFSLQKFEKRMVEILEDVVKQ